MHVLRGTYHVYKDKLVLDDYPVFGYGIANVRYLYFFIGLPQIGGRLQTAIVRDVGHWMFADWMWLNRFT